MTIRYLQHKEIDYQKWNKCILQSVNKSIYPLTWYLNQTCEVWDALVFEDYLAVMPLPVGVKFGISYVYQPFYSQQLGIISTVLLSEKMVETFLMAIPKKFRFIEIQLNSFNKIPENSAYETTLKKNYVLDLFAPYDTIRGKYNQNTIRNLKKAGKEKITISTNSSAKELFAFIKNGTELKYMPPKGFASISRLINMCLYNRVGIIYAAYDQNNQVCAVAFFLSLLQKHYYLLGHSNQIGKDNKAMFLIFDTFIKKFASTYTTMDFEGSEVDGISRFYEGFGAEKTFYPTLKINRLPWPLKSFKK